MKKKLKSLEEHNSLRSNLNIISNEPVLNGIACPDCGAELYDTQPNMTLTSCPPQKHIGCKECGYNGYAYI